MLSLHTSARGFFNDTATTEISTLSLHDALPICERMTFTPPTMASGDSPDSRLRQAMCTATSADEHADRKSTRLNSSHANISYAVFCLKTKKALLAFIRARGERGRYVPSVFSGAV